MSVRFEHLAIAAWDKQRFAPFLSNLLGLPEPSAWGPFLSLDLEDGVHLDYAEPKIDFPPQDYALLVSDEVFDHALAQIKQPGPGALRMRSTTTTAGGVSTSTIPPAITSS